MRVLFIVFCFVVPSLHLRAQTFNILPDVGGIEMQAWSKAIISDSTSIYIFGHRYDTTVSGYTSMPWLGEFSYSGKLIKITPISDPLYTFPFNINHIHVTHKLGDIYYIFTVRSSTPYLFELNVKTGEIIKSTLINQIYTGLRSILYDHKNKISLLTYGDFPNIRKTFITELDTFLNTKRVIEVANFKNNQTPRAFKVNNDLSYSLVGNVAYPDSSGNLIYDSYFIKTDTMGNLLVKNLSPAPIPVAQLIVGSNTVEVDDVGNWIIAGQQHINYPDCENCEDLIPYIFSASHDFSTLLWQTRFFDLPIPRTPTYFLYGMTKTHDGYIGAGDYLKFVPWPATYWPAGGLLFKASISGDSLWMRKYIPLNWEESRAVWAQLHDIHTTPFGSIVAAGVISDRELSILRPWILHLDSDGCLVPGCSIVGTEEENIHDEKINQFKIYPNPVSDELYLLSTITTTDQINIRIVTNEGIELKSRNFNPQAGYQYILPVHDLPSGVYHLVLTDNKASLVESHTFIRH